MSVQIRMEIVAPPKVATKIITELFPNYKFSPASCGVMKGNPEPGVVIAISLCGDTLNEADMDELFEAISDG